MISKNLCNNKSYVTIEQNVCPVCGKTFETGTLLYEQLKEHADHEVEFHIKDSNEFEHLTRETQGFSKGASRRLLLDIEYKVIGHCNTCNKEILNCSVDSPEWSGAAEAIGSIWGKCQDAAPASTKEN